MIEVTHLTKQYGGLVAVDDLSFTVEPGTVTGFLGPNGAGKSTTMRMILGLDRPTAGSATLGGRRYQDWPDPAAVAGACLNPRAVQDGRTAAAHLRWVCRAAGADVARVAVLLDRVGIASAANRRIGALSLGMRQRLGIAAALVRDPQVLVLDEPLNGLDPEGIVWARDLLKDFAATGRTVFVSSHLMNEMQETADHVVIIARGRLLASLSIAELTTRASGGVRVVATDVAGLLDRLPRDTVVEQQGADAALVKGISAEQIGRIAADHHLALSELTPQRAGLETAFLELTSASAGSDESAA